MSTIYLVMARGGEYDMAWKRVVSAHPSHEAAEACIEQYKRWEAELLEATETCLADVRTEHEMLFDDDSDEEDVARITNNMDITIGVMAEEILKDMRLPPDELERYENFHYDDTWIHPAEQLSLLAERQGSGWCQVLRSWCPAKDPLRF